MKKRVQLICLSVLIFLAIFVVLSSAIFSFSNASVDYLTTQINTSINSENALKNSGLKYGKSIFFLNKKSAQNLLEKNNPYIKVVNIETVFPNSIIFHVAERQEMFAIKYENKYLIIDNEGKILNIKDNFVNNAQSAILLENYKVNNTTSQTQNDAGESENKVEYSAGDFIKNNTFLKQLAITLQEWKLSFRELKAHIISISINGDDLLLNMRCGLTIKVFHFNSNLSNKINLAFSVYDKAEDIENKTLLEIRDVKNANDEYELKGFIS